MRTPLGEVRRSRTLEELDLQFAASTTEACREHYRSFQAKPDDLFISTYPKSGTTWMQQIVHGLRSRGDMGFGEISEVIPFIEVAHDCGLDLNAAQGFTPRAFKTHLNAHGVPQGARYIVVLRDPKDAAVSFYNFMVGWYLEPGCVSLEDFVRRNVVGSKTDERYWSHLASWWPRRHEADVIMFCFEDIKTDPRAAVRKVADFMGIEELDEALEELVLHQSSISFMREHKHQFDDNLLRRARDEAIGLPPDGESSKVASGEVGEHQNSLSAETAQQFDALWAAEISPLTGAGSYDELRGILRSEAAN